MRKKIKRFIPKFTPKRLVLLGGGFTFLVGLVTFQNMVCERGDYYPNPALTGAVTSNGSSSGLRISASSSIVSPGGVVTLTASGGTPPYYYSLTSGPNTGYVVNNMYKAPSYKGVTATVMVNDSLKGTATTSISVGGTLSLTPSSSTVGANGRITLTASGGTPPYIFSIVSGYGTINGNIYDAPTSTSTTILQVQDSAGGVGQATISVAGSEYGQSAGLNNPQIYSPVQYDRVFGTVPVKFIGGLPSGSRSLSLQFSLDDTSVNQASFSYNNMPWEGGNSGVISQTYNLDTTKYSNGLHRITVQATTEYGQSVVSNQVTIANNTSSTVGPMGGNGGGAFGPDKAPADSNMIGMNVNAGYVINQVQPVYEQGFGPVSTQKITKGGSFGGTSGYSVPLFCSSADGYRVSGVSGTVGTYQGIKQVVQLGIVCDDQKGQNPTWTSSLAGGGSSSVSDSSSVTLSCPQGTFVVGISGHSGTRLDQLSLICK